jgi:PQQ-dependent dehydrogenase (methanol/ethanol family)
MQRRLPWLLVALLLVARTAAAQPSGQVAIGQGLFQTRCADCHGIDAKGVHGPDLTIVFGNGATDAQVLQTIRRGVPGTEMPASNAPEAELRAIVAYLHTLGATPGDAVVANAANGERLFASSCLACHRVNGRGGVLGPDLSRVGVRRSATLLTQDLRDAGAVIAPGYQAVTLVTIDGQRIRGARKNEDAYSIQIMDTRERLQGYRKAELREVVAEKGSLMPNFAAERLSDRDLKDLLGYLTTLRGADVVQAFRPADEADLKVRTTPDVVQAFRPAVTSQDLLDGLKNPTRWLQYSGDYTGKRHSPLTQITPKNVDKLTAQWAFQSDTLALSRGFESTPLVVDGVIYLTGANGSAWAIDARSGRTFWRYRRPNAPDLTAGAGYPVNRGFAMLGDRLFMVTLDAHLLALDAKTGAVVWDSVLEDYKAGYAATPAPLVVKDKVIVGSSGGENPTRGFIAAYDATTGKQLWRFYTIPNPGEKGSETWPSPEVAIRGGAATWVTGSYDPELNLVYYGTGNPNPDYYGAERQGDNLYTCSIVALDADTGQLKWYYQFTPHDTHDWDSDHIPVLADVRIGGQSRKAVMVANRNGFFYALDRASGKLLLARPFTDTNWAREIGADGRPIVLEPDGTKKCLPDFWGGTNFMPPSYDPALNLFFVTARETCVTYFAVKPEIKVGETSVGGGVRRVADRIFDYGALRALDASTGERKWELRYTTPSLSGVMSTASGLVFTGDNEGNFMAVDAKTGKPLWHYATGASIWGAAATTYMLDGRQYVLIPSGAALVAFALPN